jgi:hypothetical protein
VSRVYGSVAAKEDSGRGHQEGARRVAQAFGYTVPCWHIFPPAHYIVNLSSFNPSNRKKSCHPSRKRPTWACHVAIRSSTPTSRRYRSPTGCVFYSISLNALDSLSVLQGEVVVDLGSGGGLDCFLAAQKGALRHGPSQVVTIN